MSRLRTTGPRMGGSTKGSVSDRDSQASNRTPRSAFSTAASIALGNDSRGDQPIPSRSDEAAKQAATVSRLAQSSKPPLPEAGNSFMPGAKQTSAEERSRRKIAAIVSGLRSKYWGKKGALTETFRAWDKDSSGYIDSDELQHALTTMGYKATEEETKALISVFDENGDGVVQYEDFVALLCGDQKSADALPASHKDTHFLNSLAKSVVSQDEAGFAYDDPEGLAAGDVSYHSKAAHALAMNQGRAVKTWGGIAHKKIVALEEAQDIRAPVVADLANGRSADVLKESVRRLGDKAEAELRGLFVADILTKDNDEDAEAVRRGLAPAAVVYDGGHAMSLTALRAAALKEHAKAHGHTDETALEIGLAAEPLLLRKRTEQLEQSLRDAEDVPVRSFDRSLTATARVAPVREDAPIPMVGTDAGPASHLIQIRTGVTARAVIPGGHNYDPLSTVPATGAQTVIVGTVSNVRPAGTVNQLLERSVRKARLMGRMPLEGTFMGEGTDSGHIAATMHAKGIDSFINSLREQDGGLDALHHGHGGGDDEIALMPDHERAGDRHAAGRLRDARLQERTMGWLERTGGSTRDHHAGVKHAPLAATLHAAHERKLKKLGLSGEDSELTTSKVLTLQFDGMGKMPSHVDTGARGEASDILAKARKAGQPGAAGSVSHSEHGSTARSVASAAEEKEESLHGGSRAGDADALVPGAAKGPGSVAGSDATGSTAANSQLAKDALLFTGAHYSSTGLVGRLTRAEGHRTTYLIAPPPGIVTSIGAEPPEWHYATAARLQQMQTPIPEQHFDRLAKLDARSQARQAVEERLAEVARSRQAALDFLQADLDQRVQRKRDERTAYAHAVMHRKGRVEAALFGDATKVTF